MTVDRVKFDHVSFGVADAVSALDKLRADFGAVPLTGEQSAQFRYVISHVGTAPGVLVELMDATNRPDGFLQRFLDRGGDGPHHLTFEVPDLDSCIAGLAELGIPVIQVKDDFPPWREAFIHPDDAPGILIQIATSTCSYPPVPELLEHGVTLTAEQMPHTDDGADRLWWTAADAPAGPQLQGSVCGVGLRVSDLARAEAVFAKALDAQMFSVGPDVVRFSWDGLFVEVHESTEVGLHAVYIDTAPGTGTGHLHRAVAGVPFLTHGATPTH